MANGIDNNPRSLLYQSLVNNKDKEVSEHFSQWDEKEFDSLLANDKKFQDDLFDDLSSIGVAKDKGQFLKQYTVPKAPGAQPKAPAAQPSPVEEKPKDEGRSLLGGIKQFFKSTLADFALPVGVKEAGEEAAKKKIQETGLSERGGGEYGKRPIPIEKDPIFRYETDQQNFVNSQIARDASTWKGTTLDWTKEEEANYQASKKAADDSYKNAQKEINKIINNTLPWIEKSEGTDPNKNIYLKSLATGRTSVNQQMVRDMANKIAVDSGLEPNGMASNLLTTSLSAALQYERDKPEVEAEADRIFKKKYGQGIKDAISTDVQGPSLQKIQEIKTLAKNQAKSAAKIAQMDAKAKMDLESNTYKTAMQSLQAEMDNDADVQTFVSSLDQKAFSRMEELVKAGQITPEEANNILSSEKSMKARQDQVNAFISNKYQPKQLAAYNSYLNKVSELNNRYNLRVRRQIDEIQKGAQKQVDEIASSLKGRKISPVLAARLDETYRSAANIVSERQRGKERAEDVNASRWNNFVNSTISGLAEGIGSTALTFGMNDVAAGADVLASTFKPSDLAIQGYKDIGFSGDKWARSVMTFGNFIGRMAPGAAAGAAMALGTQGIGMASLPRLLLTSYTGAAAETADIMGTIEKEMFRQTEGDAVAAADAKAKALESQLKIAPAYLLNGLPFFSKFLNFIKVGRLTGLARFGAATGINLIEETAQEVPQGVFEEIILAGKDPSFKNLIENTTWEKTLNTSAQVLPMAPIGGAGHLFDGTMNELARKSAAGYYAKNLLANASHPGLIQQNQTQWLTQLADQKGQRFAGQMVGILLQKGNISKAQANVLASQMERYSQFSEMADRAKMNPVMKQAAFLLYDRAMQAKNSKNTEAADAALQQYNNFMQGNGAELVMVMMPGGNYNVYTYDDFLGVLGNDDFRSAIAEDKSNPNSGSIRITSFDQSPNAEGNPKWQQIVKQFNTPVEKPSVSEDDVEKDVRIEEAQKRTGFQFTLPLANMPVEYQAIIDAIQNNEEGVTPDEISATQNYLQGISNMMTNMMGVPTRNLTTGQINESLDQINDINEIISQYQNNQILGPETVAQLDEMDAESEQEDADLSEKAAGYTPMMFESESEVPDQYKPLLERATLVRMDGKDMIQIIVPNQMIAQEQAAIEGETAPEVAAPTQPEAPAPQAQPSTVQAPEAPKAMTAKINLFTDDEVYDMLSDKEQKMYDDALFDGNQDAANSIIRAKRKQLLDKEIQLAEVSQVSDKVRQSFAKAGIDIQLLSADEFVQKLKEAGESASRTQEGVFDDNRGKIYINVDALKTGWGTTVVWHEAIHPVMNIINNSNKALYDKIHRGILANAKANPEGGMKSVINDVERLYTDEKRYTDADRKDEIIVEVLARLSAGTMSFSELQPTLRQQFIDLINRIGRILGLSKAEVSDMKAIKDLAKKITETIKEGRDLSEIVGAENIGKYQREESDRVQSRLSATENPVYFKNIAEFASKSTFNNKLEFKKEIQQALESYIPELKRIYGRSFDPKKYNELTKRYLTDILVREAVDAITKHPEAIGWYDEKTRAALAIIELMHPEIATDEEAKGAFILALAVMSNGNLVDANFDLAEKQYRHYKETGRFDTEGGYGNQQDAIIKSLKFINHLLDNNVTMTDLNEFFTTIYKVKDLKAKMDKETIDLAGGENADQSVFGAIVLGPKIGNGFYMNLWGEFGQLTMDRWFMRTWGRMTGTLIEIDKELIGKNKKRVSDAISAIKESKEARALLKKHIPSISGMNSVDIAKKVNKLSINKAIRNELTENELTNELRKASNNLVKNISGEKEAPGSGGERIFIREVFKDVLQELEKNHNIEITMADLQAVLWYPEKILYESFKKGKSYEEVSETYNDEEAPDYQNAAKKLALKSGIDASRINEAIERERKRSGSAQRSAVEGAREANSDFNKGIVSKIKEAAIERKRIEKVEKAEKKKAKKQASLGGRGEFVNTPLGVGKGLKNVASQNEDVITTKISVAPFYSVKVKNIDEANAVLSTPAFIRYKKDIEDIAKAAGIKIKNIDEGIGGFAFDDGTIVKEATTVLEVTGSWQNIVDFAALSGALTPEVQESTIAGRYVDENTKEHNADEYTVQIDNTEAAFQAAIDAGFDKAGFTLLNDEIRFYNVFKYRIEDIKEKIDTFGAKYKEYGGTIKSKAKRSVQSEYIDYDDRAKSLGRIAANALQPGSNWAGLRDRIDFAQKRNEAFRDWKKVKKSKEADEYADLRREQIEAGSRGDVLSDKKLERIKELEKFFETPLTTVVSTDEEKYLEAKAEIDAIANDVAKMVAGGFASPFKIKRPARAAIKVVRWYSLNPNMLGDGSRTNIIVNTNQDADYLFQQIRDRFTIPGDRVEYDMPTGLGYPKRLIEIRTSNGKIAEIQVMTPQGYLAKDGVKDFPDDKQDLAREALGEVQDRLGWKIPDGVGHYFYEIERDTNVQNELRKEAVRVSNLYYEAFLNPDSTLSDSEFRKAISDFKDRVDSADKSKWDETNKGEAPASLVEYLGGKPQASLGGRQAAPSFAELDEILDMSPVKSRAAREKLIDQYGKETVDRMIEISRNFTKIINSLEEQGVVEKDCP